MTRPHPARVDRASFFTSLMATRWPSSTAWVLLIVCVVVSAFLQRNFFSQYSISSSFSTFLPLVLVAFGQSIVVIGGGLDLSIGAIVALAAACSITVMEATGGSVIAGVGVGVAVGAFCGAINGVIVAGLRLQPLILTFATASVFSGLTLWVLPAPGGRVPETLTGLLRLAIIQVPVSVLLVVGVAAIWFVLGRTRLMRHIYATGSDEEAAFNSLVPVSRARALSYTLAGAFAGLAAVAVLANSGSGDPFIGASMALDSIAAVVIGGIALRGGFGSPIGAVLGAIVLSLISSILFFAGIGSNERPLAQGLVVIAALALSAATQRRAS